MLIIVETSEVEDERRRIMDWLDHHPYYGSASFSMADRARIHVAILEYTLNQQGKTIFKD